MEEEKSDATIEKYMRDVTALYVWNEGCVLDKSRLLEYKSVLAKKYAPASINSKLSSLNAFFTFIQWHDMKLKTIKIQRRIFTEEVRELSKEEYRRLLEIAKEKRNKQIFYIMQTVCSTGIRISELQYVTVESLSVGHTCIIGKGKRRTVFYPFPLCELLLNYAREQKIKNGSVFITKSRRPINRSNVWGAMKKLCEKAGVPKEKVFPHNLRHLFARAYYSQYKDIVRLADILGHSNINTTRIYTMESGDEHRKQIQSLELLSVKTT